jgi:ABC-2 type transport system permease protein
MKELFESLKFVRLVKLLTYLDFKRKYRRSFIGPFWTTISTGLTVGAIALVFGRSIMGEDMNYLLYVVIGMIVWSYISIVIAESNDVLLLNESIIKQMKIPFYVFTMRLMSRNFLLMLHNLILILICYIISPFELRFAQVESLVGFFFLTVNLFFISSTIGIISSRFRDVGQLVTNGLPLFFYATPIIWSVNSIDTDAGIGALLKFNPLFYFFDVIRSPLMGKDVNLFSYAVIFTCTIINIFFSILLYSRYKNKVAYWL